MYSITNFCDAVSVKMGVQAMQVLDILVKILKSMFDSRFTWGWMWLIRGIDCLFRLLLLLPKCLCCRYWPFFLCCFGFLCFTISIPKKKMNTVLWLILNYFITKLFVIQMCFLPRCHCILSDCQMADIAVLMVHS